MCQRVMNQITQRMTEKDDNYDYVAIVENSGIFLRKC